MTSRRHNFQFRLPEELEEIISVEAKRRKVSPNEYARSLIISALNSEVGGTDRADMLFKMVATMAFQSAYSSTEILRQINPHMSEEEIIAMANEKIFTKSLSKRDELLARYGIDA